jgi:hypothetical protein
MSAPAPPPQARTPTATRLGQIAQGVVIGILLVLALFELLAQMGNVTPFKYQGF